MDQEPLYDPHVAKAEELEQLQHDLMMQGARKARRTKHLSRTDVRGRRE